MKDRLELAGVQVPPLPLRLVIAQRARRAALRTWPRKVRGVFQKDVNLASLQPKIDLLHAPWLRDPKNPGVQLAILHRRSSAALYDGKTALKKRLGGHYPTDGKERQIETRPLPENRLNPLQTRKSLFF
jgi:hypothetical protein